jgi:hypothetical protein
MKAKSLIISAIIFVLVLSALDLGVVSREKYLELARAGYEQSMQKCPEAVENWLKTYKPDPIWGYSPPSHPVVLAGLAAFFYEKTGKEEYAEQAAKWLSQHHTYKKAYPENLIPQRAEYSKGLPALTNFFDLPVFSRAYLRIKKSRSLTPDERREIERSIAESADYIFYFPEWGPMNRAMLRAEGLIYAALALPDHPQAAQWRKLAGVLASDSWGKWEEEDAQIYHPVWLYSLMSYSEALGDDSIYEMPTVRYYFEYFLHLLSPAGMVPDFGDARWNDSWMRYLVCFEKAASVYRKPEYKWAAGRIYEKIVRPRISKLDAGLGLIFSDCYRWADDKILPKAPNALSEEVLEDLIGKKIVFRNGWDDQATYLLLNYRDEGDYALVPRDYLRNTIPVEEEKMHHGHSDENAIVLLMNGGSVLLHDAGYRTAIPSGPYGAFRADYYHNRLVARKNKLWYEQSLLEFLRNSGAYRTAATQKIDFFKFTDCDLSRTRMRDASLGYEWDRVIVYLKRSEAFAVFDIVKILESDYYTFANLWHGQKILEQGDHYYVLANDSIESWELSKEKALLVYFPERGIRKDSTFSLERHSQEEKTIYQSISSHYHAGDIETFTTVLVPVRRGEAAKPVLDSIKLLDVNKPRDGIGLHLASQNGDEFICVKTDLNKEILTENIRPRYNFESGRVKFGPVETDASFFYGKLEGENLSYSAANMVKIIYKDKVLFEGRLSSAFTCQPDDLSTKSGVAKWRYWEEKVLIK